VAPSTIHTSANHAAIVNATELCGGMLPFSTSSGFLFTSKYLLAVIRDLFLIDPIKLDAGGCRPLLLEIEGLGHFLLETPKFFWSIWNSLGTRYFGLLCE
jgi:hypothetical protein